MIAVQNIDSIAAIEELYSALGEGHGELTLATHLRGSLGHPFRFVFTYFEDKLPFSASGKFEEFISHVKA